MRAYRHKPGSKIFPGCFSDGRRHEEWGEHRLADPAPDTTINPSLILVFPLEIRLLHIHRILNINACCHLGYSPIHAKHDSYHIPGSPLQPLSDLESEYGRRIVKPDNP